MCLLDARKSSQFESEQKKRFFFLNHKSHILEFHEISLNYLTSRKLPENDQDFPKFGKFPSKWTNHRGSSHYELYMSTHAAIIKARQFTKRNATLFLDYLC